MDEGNKKSPSYIKPFSAVRNIDKPNFNQQMSRDERYERQYDRDQITKSHKDLKFDINYERQRERPEKLQPNVMNTSKHWYDEYPVGDRRKNAEEGLQNKKLLQELEIKQREEEELRNKQELERFKENRLNPKYEQYDIPKYQNYNLSEERNEGYSDRVYDNKGEFDDGRSQKYDPYYTLKDKNVFASSSQDFGQERFNQAQPDNRNYQIPNDQRYSQDFRMNKSPSFKNPNTDLVSSPRFERNNFDDLTNQKNHSRSYNRNIGIHKRAFANPNAQKDDLHNSRVSNDDRQLGRSANHGFERNFKGNNQSSFSNQSFYGRENFVNCELKFNKRSANYDMSEIELPAYCNTHPDGKLLYIITPEGHESELGCAHCALNLNKASSRCSIIEVKQKLEDYIGHASQLLFANKTQSNKVDPQLVNKINISKDKEIAMIRQYYDMVMNALAEERDKQIQEVVQTADQNIQILSSSVTSQNKSGKGSKIDIKLNNFCVELGKVVEGVDDTGIHIKEL